MTNELQYLYDLLQKKSENYLSDEDKEKLQLAKDILQVPNCFFELEFEAAIGLLAFIGVPEDQIEELYTKLISPAAFIRKNEKVTISNEK